MNLSFGVRFQNKEKQKRQRKIVFLSYFQKENRKTILRDEDDAFGHFVPFRICNNQNGRFSGKFLSYENRCKRENCFLSLNLFVSVLQACLLWKLPMLRLWSM